MTAARSPARTLIALAAVLALAAGLRAPQLQTVPHLTDESAEVLFAHAIAFDGARPLTHTDAYDGPFWPYVLAAAFRIFGSSPALPRLFTLTLGLAAVAAAFALGGSLARPEHRRGASAVAGLLMAANFTHAVVGSRVAWSNATTPLWTTLAALALVAAVRRGATAAFALAGILAGLALHTHPSVIVLLGALALWCILDPAARARFRSPGPWIAALAAVAAYSPVIVFNVREGFQSLIEARSSANMVADPTAGGWFGGMPAAVAQLGRSMVGGFTPDGADTDLMWTALAGLAVAAVIVALVALARDGAAPAGRALPLIAVLVAIGALPFFNSNWTGVLEARYVGYTWPLACAAIGATAARAWGSGRASGRIGIVAVVALLAALPATRVLGFDAAALAEGFDNRRLVSMTADAGRRAAAGAVVLVDNDLREVRWRAGGHPRRAIEYLLTLEGVPFTRAPESKINHFLTTGGDLALFLAGPTAERLGARHRLEAVDVAARAGEGAWGLYGGGR